MEYPLDTAVTNHQLLYLLSTKDRLAYTLYWQTQIEKETL